MNTFLSEFRKSVLSILFLILFFFNLSRSLSAQNQTIKESPSSWTILNMYDFNYDQLGLIPYSFGLRYDKGSDRKTGNYFGRQKGNIYQLDVRYQNQDNISPNDFGFEISDFLLGLGYGNNLIIGQFKTINFQVDGFLGANYLWNRKLPKTSAGFTTRSHSLELSSSLDFNIRFKLSASSAFHLSWPIPIIDYRLEKHIKEDPNLPLKDQGSYFIKFHAFDFDKKNVLRFGFTFYI